VFEKLAVIGCGLMGGSFAMALRAAGRVQRVSGYSRSPASAQRAVELGIVDEAFDEPIDAVRGADLVLIAVPVGATQAALSALLPALSPQALVMDVGSTKRDVVAAALAAMGDRVAQFVPAHPIAGKATGGIEQAEATLYQGCTTILTPLAANPTEAVARAQAAWEAVGSRVVPMSAQAHDQTFAAVSHLPHLLAFAYMQGLMGQGPEALRQHLSVAGPGFRDFSRIAGSTSAIWRDIFSANRDEVLTQLTRFEASLAQFRQALTDGRDEDLARWVDEASAVRSRWPSLPD
jgi:prephenate dehydrogenase